MGIISAGCLVGAAVILVKHPHTARRRLRALHPAPGKSWFSGPAVPVRVVAALGGVVAALLVGGWLGLVVGLAAGLALDRGLHRVQPRAVRVERQRAATDLPLAVDLLAAALRAGAPMDRAAGAVGLALGGPLGERLVRVSRALRLGATAEEAWRHLGEESAPRASGAEGFFGTGHPAGFGRLAHAAVRSAASGAALAGVLGRLADELRAARAAEADAASRRAGVLVVLPLGLCFLPAFVLAGLVPVIIAVLGDVL